MLSYHWPKILPKCITLSLEAICFHLLYKVKPAQGYKHPSLCWGCNSVPLVNAIVTSAIVRGVTQAAQLASPVWWQGIGAWGCGNGCLDLVWQRI